MKPLCYRNCIPHRNDAQLLVAMLMVLDISADGRVPPQARQHNVPQSIEQKRQEAFTKAMIVSSNVLTFEETEDIENSPNVTESLAIRKNNPIPAVLICSKAEKEGQPDECGLEWGSDALHAHYLMQDLRASVVWLRHSSKWRDALMDDTKSTWLEMRNIFCEGHPRWLYTDLDGVSRACGK
jgi:hypothetical protein